MNYQRLTELFLFFFIFASLTLSAQFVTETTQDSTQETKNTSAFSWNDRLLFGGNFWISSGSYLTNIEISPMLGYRLSKRLVAGSYIIFQYYGYKDYYTKFSTTIYGVRPYTQYLLFNNINALFSEDNLYALGIYARIESEILNIDSRYFGSPYLIGNTSRLWIQTTLVGFGLQEDYGGSGLNISILWDISHNIYYPYSNPLIRFGFYF